MAPQAHKHVTHNEALRTLDAIVQLAVSDKDLATPPGSPDDGDCYIVAASPTGAWSGEAGKIAAFQDGAWAFYTPREGWLAWVADEATLYIWSGSAWDVFIGGGSGLANVVDDPTPRLGGALDTDGNAVGFDDGTGITDDAGNEQLLFHKTASAINQVGITNAATGNAPQIAAEGGDTNIDLTLAGGHWPPEGRPIRRQCHCRHDDEVRRCRCSQFVQSRRRRPSAQDQQGRCGRHRKPPVPDRHLGPRRDGHRGRR
jgi:hypothetical protein